MGDLNYVYAVARIRVKEKSLLSNADVAQMCGMKDADAVLGYLSEKGWGSAGERQSADQMLAAEEAKAAAALRELGAGKEILEVLSLPQMYHNLKAGIKTTCTGTENPKAFYKGVEPSEDTVTRSLTSKDFKLLPEHMRAAAERALEVMLRARDGQMCDVIVDRACLDAMAATGEKSTHEILRTYLLEQVAVADIRTAVRGAKTGKSLAFFKEALAPVRGLSVQKLAIAAAESEKALFDDLSGTAYAGAAEAIKVSPSAFERWCDDKVMESIRPQKRNAFSIGPVVAYYLARQTEIRTARIVLTAKANGFSEEAIRERVREMYV